MSTEVMVGHAIHPQTSMELTLLRMLLTLVLFWGVI